MIHPLVQELAADQIPVVVTCRVLGISKKAYYARCKNPISQRDRDDAHLLNAAVDIQHDHPEFDTDITDKLAHRDAGHGVQWSPGRCGRSGQ